jgi:organic hydroperoxide reductase OsmC/OhrA
MIETDEDKTEIARLFDEFMGEMTRQSGSEQRNYTDAEELFDRLYAACYAMRRSLIKRNGLIYEFDFRTKVLIASIPLEI